MIIVKIVDVSFLGMNNMFVIAARIMLNTIGDHRIPIFLTGDKFKKG